MSQTSDQRSADFLKIADQFKLGALTTESSHPVTAHLSEVAKQDIAAGLKLLFDVDDDVVRKYREFAESGRARGIADTVLAALQNGGNLYFTGCGSTGRLSIQLASIWRDFWQQRKPLTPSLPMNPVVGQASCLSSGAGETDASPDRRDALSHYGGHSPVQGFKARTSARGILSPSDGERVAEGRVRGDSSEWENRAFPVMAGGDFALIKAVEGFEDFTAFGKKQISDLGVNNKDVVFAITEGGETSFVIGTAWKGVEVGAKVYFVYNNPDDVLCEHVQRSREVIQDARIEKLNLTTGPMGITGSTRMQATSIQLAVMVTILEMVVRELTSGWGERTREPSGESGKGSSVASPHQPSGSSVASPHQPSGSSVASPHQPASSRRVSETAQSQPAGQRPALPEEFLAHLTQLHATLKSPELLAQLTKLTAMEESVYRAGRKNNYFADRVGIDMLTDTTERSPTYCTPPFRKFDDTTATESWAFLYVPYPNSDAAWERVCKRQPRCVAWQPDAVRGLVPDDKYARTVEIIGKISYPELMRFRIGLDGLPNRPLGAGDSAVGLVIEAEKDSLLDPRGFHRVQLENAVKAGAKTGLIYVGSEQSCREMKEFVAQWNPSCAAVFLTVPDTGLLLDGVMRVGLKMLLNTLSTGTMVRLGRVMGNYMIWVVPSNLKLIDRATRYIQKLTGLDYVAGNKLLFEVFEYVEPRMKADQTYPPVVGVSVMRHRFGLTNEAAEQRLMAELG